MEDTSKPYHKLSKEIQDRIIADREKGYINPAACPDLAILRRDMNRDRASLWRPAFVRDIDKIMNVPYYNRYSDKTQVFSFYKNDDISRRAYHVQLVAKHGRNIGRLLGLNTDLIEAISLGHDIGHTPFGHEGERLLNELYHANTGRYFNHNVHSVRVLDRLVNWNISLQTLDGIICHNGELEQQEYRPCSLDGFEEFDAKYERCMTDGSYIRELVPSTLEGCVMRICDIIAYLGKDREDAKRVGLIKDDELFSKSGLGSNNGEIINNLIVNIIENSYGREYLSMDEEYYEMLVTAKKENGKLIYMNADKEGLYKTSIAPMMEQLYEHFLLDLKAHNEESLIYKHHIKQVKAINEGYPERALPYEEEEANQLVVDYIASMTDDYFVDVYKYIFPKSKLEVRYRGYFDEV